jgi:lipoprotein-releasing system permease protein
MLSYLLTISLGVTLLLTLVFLLTGRRVVVQLMLKYLFKRRLAWVSIVAVMLFVWLVLVVYSVMGGWLKMFKESYKVMSGDLVISRPGMKGFSGYEDIIKQLRAMPDVKGAIPLIRTFGLADLNGNFTDYVMVVGLPSDPMTGEIQVDDVFKFSSTLWMQNPKPQTEVFWPAREKPSFRLWEGLPYAAMLPKVKDADKKPGIILGGIYAGIRRDDKTGQPNWNQKFPPGDGGSLGAATSIPAQTNIYWIVDGSRTQLPNLDRSVYVPFDALQREMLMQGGGEFIKLVPDNDSPGGVKEVLMKEPPLASEIHIALKDPSQAAAMKQQVEQLVTDITGELPTGMGSIQVQTWEEMQSAQIGAIQNEIGLVTTLFAMISVVATFMVFVIFYTIVTEKTRDIGILKSCGTSSFGVALIFLGYGAFIGVVGGAMGVLMGWLTVENINGIHSLLGRLFGIVIFSAQTYAFDKIPDRMDWSAALVTAVVAVWASIAGAVFPAIRAALQQPVKALRFE